MVSLETDQAVVEKEKMVELDRALNSNVAVLMKPMIALAIGDIAEDANIPFRMFENDNAGQEGKMDDRTFYSMMKENNPRMFDYVREKVNEQIRQGNAPRQPEEENFLNAKGDK